MLEIESRMDCLVNFEQQLSEKDIVIKKLDCKVSDMEQQIINLLQEMNSCFWMKMMSISLTKVDISHEVNPVQDTQHHHHGAAMVKSSLSCLQNNIREAFSKSFAVSSNIQNFLWLRQLYFEIGFGPFPSPCILHPSHFIL